MGDVLKANPTFIPDSLSSNLTFSVCILGIILDVKIFCNSRKSLGLHISEWSISKYRRPFAVPQD